MWIQKPQNRPDCWSKKQQKDKHRRIKHVRAERCVVWIRPLEWCWSTILVVRGQRVAALEIKAAVQGVCLLNLLKCSFCFFWCDSDKTIMDSQPQKSPNEPTSNEIKQSHSEKKLTHQHAISTATGRTKHLEGVRDTIEESSSPKNKRDLLRVNP